ncbi:uncharacterized protein LOC116408316 [Xenopus tropicalis]|uniref:Uncharacterized protein LOC116408316 n=1 Tax=Xenopus tropicalis TaxID=8364 RepID=A0A8J1J2M2_XENTR|nr:uncharacterized protein LOC116408316 [Xenopus tropicalis]
MDRELKEIEGIYNEQLEELREAWIDSLAHLEDRIDDILGVVDNMQALILEVKGKEQVTPKDELTDESYETAMGSSSSSENTAEEQPKSSEGSDISEGEEQEGSKSGETSEEKRMETTEDAEEKNTVKRVSFAENLCTLYAIPQWKHKKEGKFLRFFRRIFRKKSKKGGNKENTENCDESGQRTDDMVKGSTTKRDVHFDANLSTYNDGTRQWKSTMLDHDEDLLQND